MLPETPVAIQLADYALPDFIVTHVDLHVILGPRQTSVQSRLHMTPRPGGRHQLSLDGEDLQLAALAINDRMLAATDYVYANNKLTINILGGNFQDKT